MNIEEKCCIKCAAVVLVETDEQLKKEYPYYCPECDENLYSFEAIEKKTNSKGGLIWTTF